jgi:L,D-transpeptidase ErfK/SrfK
MWSAILGAVIVSVLLVQQASATVLPIVNGVAGVEQYYVVKRGDKLSQIARSFDISLSELFYANPKLHPDLFYAGSTLVIPTRYDVSAMQRKGIVIDKGALRLFYFKDENTVITSPIAMGKKGWETPTGSTKIIAKKKDPVWTPPPSIRKENPSLPKTVPAGADNPLGGYALYLGWSGYLIHGTNAPRSIGKYASHGCMRMYPEDIETLFKEVPVGTQVSIIPGVVRPDLVFPPMPAKPQVQPSEKRVNIVTTPLAPSEIKPKKRHVKN